MTTPKEALEQAVSFARQVACIEGVRRAPEMKAIAEQYQAIFEQALASLEGDAVERVAQLIEDHVTAHCDDDRRQTWLDNTRDAAESILATGLVPDEAAVRADWHTTGWDRARNSGRILLVWREFAGVREHVELGRYSDSKVAWVNTYGHPFHAEPDGWAPLLPFRTAESIRADEREKCAKIAESKQRSIRQFSVAADIAAAIRSNRREA